LADIGLPAAEVMVVGDDLEADCGGGAAAGCRTALVLSGRTRREDVESSLLRPDLVLESVASLLESMPTADPARRDGHRRRRSSAGRHRGTDSSAGRRPGAASGCCS